MSYGEGKGRMKAKKHLSNDPQIGLVSERNRDVGKKKFRLVLLTLDWALTLRTEQKTPRHDNVFLNAYYIQWAQTQNSALKFKTLLGDQQVGSASKGTCQ